MLVLSSEVHIGSYIFKQIGQVEINSSYETLTDTCTITIPRKLSFKGKSVFVDKDALFNKGDKVVVKLGYGYDNKQIVFTGFVTRIESGIPTKIFCEDSAYLLKETKPFNLSYPKLSLDQLLKDILPSGIQYKLPGEITLGKARFTKVTASQILKYLSDKFSINGWFRDSTLYMGLNYFPELQKEHNFHFQKHVIDNSLEFVKSEDVKFSVKATSILPDNSKIEVVKGDLEGTERTIHFYNVDKATLEERANKALTDFKFDGYAGSFTTFGQPNVQHGDIVNLTDNFFKERSGRYIVKAVQTTFGTSGFRQAIELAERV
ncbi:MAG TPA: hypothetical protein VK658_08810 [Chryseolinea sp.]|nr:hypothetical protein [Chryseolinea sp.]